MPKKTSATTKQEEPLFSLPTVPSFDAFPEFAVQQLTRKRGLPEPARNEKTAALDPIFDEKMVEPAPQKKENAIAESDCRKRLLISANAFSNRNQQTVPIAESDCRKRLLISANAFSNRNQQSVVTQNGHNEEPMKTRELRLSRHQQAIFEYVKQHNNAPCTCKYLSEKLGIKYGSLRSAIDALIDKNMLEKETLKKGGYQGIVLRISNFSNRFQQSVSAIGFSKQHIKKIDDDLLYSLSSICVWEMSANDLQSCYPSLAAAGFGAAHLKQLRRAFVLQGFNEEMLVISMRYLEWQLERGQLFDAKGQGVSDPIAYWMAAMMKNGYYTRPRDYADPIVEAQRLIDLEHKEKAESERLQKKQKEEIAAKGHQKAVDTLLDEILRDGDTHALYAPFMALIPAYVRDKIISSGVGALKSAPIRYGCTFAASKLLEEK